MIENEDYLERDYFKLGKHIVAQGDLYSSAAVFPKYVEVVYLRGKFRHGIAEVLFQIDSGYSTDNNLLSACFNEVVRVYEKLLVNSNVQDSAF